MAKQVVFNKDCMIGMKEYPDKHFDLAIVDPVYGDVTLGGYMKNNVPGTRWGNSGAAEKGYHDALWKQEKTGKDYFDELFRVSKNQIIWGGNYFTNEIARESQGWIVWDKKKPETISFSCVELAWTSFDSAAKIFRYKWNGFMQEDMANKEFRIHPTQKPVALYEWILKNYAKEGDKILDTHVGSGSSRLACYNLGYDFVGYEIDEVYFQAQEHRFDVATRQARLNLFE